MTQTLGHETAGPRGAAGLVFVHPNALERSCWMFQMARFSNDFRCLAVDLPGYGESAEVEGGAIDAVAARVWATVDADPGSSSPVVLVGCSVGSHVVQHMYHQRPGDVRALVLSGTGVYPDRSFASHRAAGYRARGAGYIGEHAASLFSPNFRATPVGEAVVDLAARRNASASVDTIIAMFDARRADEDPAFHRALEVPALVVAGALDQHQPGAAARLCELMPYAELVVVEDAGHASFLEHPARFNAEMERFLAHLENVKYAT